MSSTTSCCLHHVWIMATHSSPVHHHHIKPFLSFDCVSLGGWRAFLRSFRDLEVAVLPQCHQGGDCSPPVSSVSVDGSEIRLTSWGYQVGSLSHYFCKVLHPGWWDVFPFFQYLFGVMCVGSDNNCLVLMKTPVTWFVSSFFFVQPVDAGPMNLRVT